MMGEKKIELPVVVPDDVDFAVDVDFDDTKDKLPRVGVRGDLSRDSRHEATPLPQPLPDATHTPRPEVPPAPSPVTRTGLPIVAPGAPGEWSPSELPPAASAFPALTTSATPPAPGTGPEPPADPSGVVAVRATTPLPPAPGPGAQPPSTPTGSFRSIPTLSKVDRAIALTGLVRVKGGGIDRMISSGAARLSPSSLFLPMERPLEVGTTVDVEARTPSGVLRFEGVVLGQVARDGSHAAGVEVSVAPADSYTRRYLQQLAAGQVA